MSPKRHIIHIDMDAFFASVEQMDNPKYAGRPLIVGGNPKGRGVVAACSYEARKFGVHSAMSGAKAIQRCPHALFVRPRIDRYRIISLQIMHIFKQYSSLIEPLSLDEAFLDITTDHHSINEAADTAEKIRNHIFNEIGLTCSAGVSYNKFLAKVASDMNKPDGLTIITKEQSHDFLSSLAVGKFYGVGKVTEKKMHSLGIRIGNDLRRFEKEELQRFFGKAGSFFYDIVRGVDTRPVEKRKGRKSIGTETTFQTDLLHLAEIQEVIQNLVHKIEQSLQRKASCGNTLTLKVRYHDFYTVTRSLTLPSPLSSFDDIMQHIPQLLDSTDVGKVKIRLLGITISNLSDQSVKQPVQMALPFS